MLGIEQSPLPYPSPTPIIYIFNILNILNTAVCLKNTKFKYVLYVRTANSDFSDLDALWRCSLYFLVFVYLVATPGYAQSLLLAQDSGITPGGAQIISGAKGWTQVDHLEGK